MPNGVKVAGLGVAFRSALLGFSSVRSSEEAENISARRFHASAMPHLSARAAPLSVHAPSDWATSR